MKRTVILLGALLLAAPAAPSAQETAPERTPWGAPALGGTWDYSSITPMQRPEEYADQEYLTEDQAAALEQAAIDRERNILAAPARPAEAGDAAGANGHAWQWGLDLRHPGRGRPADVAHHRAAQRPVPRDDGGRQAGTGRAAGASAPSCRRTTTATWARATAASRSTACRCSRCRTTTWSS